LSRALLVICITTLALGAVSSWLLLSLHGIKKRVADTINPPFVSAVAVIFGLFVTLGASDVVQRSRELGLSSQKEANTARSLFKLAESIGPSADPVRQSLIEYLQAATTTELNWLSSQRRGESPARAQADALVDAATLFVTQAGVADIVKTQVMNKVDELRQARIQRIALSYASSSISQWLGLTLIAVLTQVVIALSHAGKPFGAAGALAAFSMAAIVAMVYLAWADGLIGPPKAISAVLPLGELLESLSRA
jgi:ABC-type multidrug transport system fused ATPase/permease subunit